ncbi:MAG: FlgB family protein [Rhodobacteraceae bacterium]|nr:MAG: FlgB family protein [Paracoccaceae bacterium]
MFEIPDVMRMAQAMARHSAARQVTISENIANANTPGFRARDLADFGATYHQPTRLAATRVSHLDWQVGHAHHVAQVDRTAPALSPNGNSVSLEREMMRGAQNKQSHELALAVYGSARSVLRTALGR